MRIRRVVHGEPALPDPDFPQPRRRPARWQPERAEPLELGVTLRLTDRERRRLGCRPALVEDLPATLRRELLEGSMRPVKLLLGEALLLMDQLERVAMDLSQTSDRESEELLDLLHRIENALNQQWNHPPVSATASPDEPRLWYMRELAISPDQRIPIALRSSELELLRGLSGLSPEAASGLESAGEGGSGARLCITIGQLDQLLEVALAPEPEERVSRLEARLELIWRAFTDGHDR